MSVRKPTTILLDTTLLLTETRAHATRLTEAVLVVRRAWQLKAGCGGHTSCGKGGIVLEPQLILSRTVMHAFPCNDSLKGALANNSIIVHHDTLS